MTITDDYNFGTVTTILDSMTDEEARECFASLTIDEHKIISI